MLQFGLKSQQDPVVDFLVLQMHRLMYIPDEVQLLLIPQPTTGEEQEAFLDLPVCILEGAIRALELCPVPFNINQ